MFLSFNVWQLMEYFEPTMVIHDIGMAEAIIYNVTILAQ